MIHHWKGSVKVTGKFGTFLFKSNHFTNAFVLSKINFSPDVPDVITDTFTKNT